jgi:hypothetical protein
MKLSSLPKSPDLLTDIRGTVHFSCFTNSSHPHCIRKTKSIQSIRPRQPRLAFLGRERVSACHTAPNKTQSARSRMLTHGKSRAERPVSTENVYKFRNKISATLCQPATLQNFNRPFFHHPFLGHLLH